MFYSPSVRVHTSENSESLVQRKPTNLLARKPFLDRSVNSKTPDTVKQHKAKLNLNKANVTEENLKIAKGNVNIKEEKLKANRANVTEEKSKNLPESQEDLNEEYFKFSFKEVADNFEDIFPQPVHFNTKGIVKILRNYCNVKDTPPPSPEASAIIPIFFELPDLEMPDFVEEPIVTPLDVDEPKFDAIDLDASL